MRVSPEQQDIIAGLYPAEEIDIRTEALEALYSQEGLVIMQGLADIQVNDFVRPLDINPDKFPFQTSHYSLGKPQELRSLIAIAQMVEDKSSGGDFGITLAGLKDKDQAAALDASADAIKNGKSLIIAIHHPPIVDLGLGLYAVQFGLSERGVVVPTAMINNRTTAFLGVQFEKDGDIAPVPDMLGLYCQETIYTMPASKRMVDSDLAAEKLRKMGINVQNDLATHRTDLLLQGEAAGDNSIYDSPAIVAVAINGTTDREVEGQPGVIGLAEVKDRTIQMLAHPNAVVLDVYIARDDNGNLIVKCLGLPYAVSPDLAEGRRQIDSAMVRRAHLLGAQTAKQTIYLGSH